MKAEWTNADNLTPSETTGKSMLILDTPKNCAECKLMFLQGIGKGICNAVDWEERPPQCPLRPLPQEKEILEYDEWTDDDWDKGYVGGWNACLREITGETE